MRASLALFAAVAALPAGAANASPWELPQPGSCASPVPANEDAQPRPAGPSPGELLGWEQLETLESLLPPEVWEWRDRFFDESMRMEIGPCFRSYAPPASFREATRAVSGRARLGPGGVLEGTPAGLAFDPASIAPDDPQAGLKWAWNVARRHQGAGRFGEIRVTYTDSRGRPAHLLGDYFVALLMGRADLAKSGYRLPWARKQRWVAGGSARDPASGARCAFRHYRRADAEAQRKGSDDVFFVSSRTRKPERVAWDPEFPLLVCAYERGFYLPRGGVVQRYHWRVAGVRDVIAPINARTPAYPEDENRDFGSRGASFASDRWEQRRALVLEASRGESWRILRYVDLETLFPLYHVEDLDGARTIIQYVGRWSGDRADYPSSSSGGAQVLDPVAQVMVQAGEVVRSEAWNTVSLPPRPGALRQQVSTTSLSKAR